MACLLAPLAHVILFKTVTTKNTTTGAYAGLPDLQENGGPRA